MDQSDWGNKPLVLIAYADLDLWQTLIARPNVSRERSTELAQALRVEVRRMSRLLASLADAVADETPAADASAEELDLVSVVQNFVQEVSVAWARRISVDSCEQNLYGRWEQLAVERAIENLLSNACKYSEPDSEVRVRILRDDHERTGGGGRRGRGRGYRYPSRGARYGARPVSARLERRQDERQRDWARQRQTGHGTVVWVNGDPKPGTEGHHGYRQASAKYSPI